MGGEKLQIKGQVQQVQKKLEETEGKELISQWASGKTFRGVQQVRPGSSVGREEMNAREKGKGA